MMSAGQRLCRLLAARGGFNAVPHAARPKLGFRGKTFAALDGPPRAGDRSGV